MKVAVLDDYQDVFRTLKCHARLKGHDVVAYRDTVKDPAKLAERLAGADAVILLQQRTPFPRAAAEKVTTLKLISQTGRNANHIDMAACTEQGIVVCGSGAGLPNHTAELTWGLIFASLRHIPEEVQRFKAGQWQTTLGTTVVGKTLGVYAYGRIGSAVARRAKAFGLAIHYHNRRRVAEEVETELEATYWESLDQMLARMDIVSINCPHTPATYHLLSARRLELLPRHAYIVNTARGEIIDENALTRKLRKGELAGVGLDVFEHGRAVNPTLLGLPNVGLLPHMASATIEGRLDMGEKVLINIKTFADGHTPPDRVLPSQL